MTASKPVFPAGLYITLVADASYCPTTRAYGWCFWIKHGDPAKTIVKSGGGIGIDGSAAAEFEALAQGINEIRAMGDGFHGKYIVIQSDCTGALTNLNDKLRNLVKRGAAKAYTKHVKGHQGNITPRNAVNTLCDRRAKAEMRKYRLSAK